MVSGLISRAIQRMHTHGLDFLVTPGVEFISKYFILDTIRVEFRKKYRGWIPREKNSSRKTVSGYPQG